MSPESLSSAGPRSDHSPARAPTLRGNLKPSLPILCLGAALFAIVLRSGEQGLVLIAGLAVMSATLVASTAFANVRVVPLFGLVMFVPFHLVHHFTYIPDHVGISNGITVEATDIFALWLFIEHLHSVRRGTARRIPGLYRACFPVALVLLADLASLYASNNLTLSAYGLLTHVKMALIFLILAVAVGQGDGEMRVACLGLMCGVLVIGVICVAETTLGRNFVENAKVQEMTTYSVFRAAGLETPTLTAGYLSAFLPIAWVGITYCKGFLKAGVAISILFGTAGLACTLSRAAWGFLLLGSIPLAIYLFRRRRIRLWHVLFCAAIGVAVYAMLGDRIASRLDEGAENLSERAGLLNTARNIAVSSPIVGVGVNTYELHMYQVGLRDQTQDFAYLVHNEFALTWAETGPLGVAALVWLLVDAMIRAIGIALRRPEIGIGLLCSLTITILEMNVESYAGGPPLLGMWVLLALILAPAETLHPRWQSPNTGLCSFLSEEPEYCSTPVMR